MFENSTFYLLEDDYIYIYKYHGANSDETSTESTNSGNMEYDVATVSKYTCCVGYSNCQGRGLRSSWVPKSWRPGKGKPHETNILDVLFWASFGIDIYIYMYIICIYIYTHYMYMYIYIYYNDLTSQTLHGLHRHLTNKKIWPRNFLKGSPVSHLSLLHDDDLIRSSTKLKLIGGHQHRLATASQCHDAILKNLGPHMGIHSGQGIIHHNHVLSRGGFAVWTPSCMDCSPDRLLCFGMWKTRWYKVLQRTFPEPPRCKTEDATDPDSCETNFRIRVITHIHHQVMSVYRCVQKKGHNIHISYLYIYIYIYVYILHRHWFSPISK